AEQLRQLTGDRQAQAGSRARLGRMLELDEFVEDPVAFFGGDPGSGVFDRECDPARGARCAARRYAQAVLAPGREVARLERDPARVRELHRVREEVQQDLSDPCAIALDHRERVTEYGAQL